jgi:hypothetical protein
MINPDRASQLPLFPLFNDIHIRYIRRLLSGGLCQGKRFCNAILAEQTTGIDGIRLSSQKRDVESAVIDEDDVPDNGIRLTIQKELVRIEHVRSPPDADASVALTKKVPLIVGGIGDTGMPIKWSMLESKGLQWIP